MPARLGQVLKIVASLSAVFIGYFVFGDPDVVLRSSDGKWADVEFRSKGRTFEVIVSNFERYKLDCSAPQANLMRATPKEQWNIFAWPSYIGDRKWQVPYSDAHPEIGSYYPPAYEKNCYNEGSYPEVMKIADENARRYISGLSLN